MNNSEQRGNYYIIADHLRTTIFALADGAEFEPKGRGYILKKLVKRSVLLAYLLGISPAQLLEVSEKLLEVNTVYYFHLRRKKKLIIEVLKKELDKEAEFINKSEKEIAKNYSPQTNANDIFFWYDTKGIPLALIRSCLEKKGKNFPEAEFQKLLTAQQKKGLKDREKKNISIF